jgi:two-component system nitrogen regulation response regulator GlnG
MPRVLFVDDDLKAHQTLRMAMPLGFAVTTAQSACEAKRICEKSAFDLILIDIGLPDEHGVALMLHMKAVGVGAPVVMLTATNEVATVVRAIKSGAADYLVKPYRMDQLRRTLARAIEEGRAPMHACSDEELSCLERIVGIGPATQQLRRSIAAYARSAGPVLILGESGTGKELVADCLHRLSERADGPFQVRNCGAIPSALFESEMFGTERGAYTGATRRAGAFESTDGGTLFLDEVGDLPRPDQVKLLRILEDGKVLRVGANTPVQVDVRFLAATNRDLAEAVRAGEFRQDLYYRLSTLTIQVPPLRSRLEDLPILVAHFLAESQAEKISLSSEAMKRLTEHNWPGNVRELRSVIERARLLAGGRPIQAHDIVFV